MIIKTNMWELSGYEKPILWLRQVIAYFENHLICLFSVYVHPAHLPEPDNLKNKQLD